ncbi:MAG TPA: hypothetical protein VKA70_12595 [Blastocatellia bacterium]|nr:hypothetical protein [Blastocatellia bacterium]
MAKTSPDFMSMVRVANSAARFNSCVTTMAEMPAALVNSLTRSSIFT